MKSVRMAARPAGALNSCPRAGWSTGSPYRRKWDPSRHAICSASTAGWTLTALVTSKSVMWTRWRGWSESTAQARGLASIRYRKISLDFTHELQYMSSRKDLYSTVLRIWDVYLGSVYLSISDPGSDHSNKRGGERKIFGQHFFGLSFEQIKRKILANSKRTEVIFTQKLSLS